MGRALPGKGRYNISALGLPRKSTSPASDQTKMATQDTAEKPDLLKKILTRIIKPKPSGVTCEYCGWNGSADDVLKAPRLNEDGVVYQISSCPNCMRNGGLVYHD